VLLPILLYPIIIPVDHCGSPAAPQALLGGGRRMSQTATMWIGILAAFDVVVFVNPGASGPSSRSWTE